jgi:hypothetical protein
MSAERNTVTSHKSKCFSSIFQSEKKQVISGRDYGVIRKEERKKNPIHKNKL